LFNEYGPTEATVWSSVYECRDLPEQPPSLPIGRPIANTRLYILDRHLNLTPPGVPGELYIGGAGVARGYLKRPALTAERFVPDPFAQRAPDVPGARLYRTGDLVRYQADGTIEFLGRIDDQVKIRGFRIELGEIEAALHAALALQAAAVVAQPAKTGGQRLIAYLVPDAASRSKQAAELQRGAGSAPLPAAGVHAAVGVCGPRCAAAHAQRQARSQGTARA
jgi:acyl-CoA synthetase (AMP-forming)/AMP-acid ligase II